jgi:hypothetical protein
MRSRFKYGGSLVLLVVTCALLWSAYAPEHWSGQIRRLVRTSSGEMPNSIPKPQPSNERIEGRAPNEVVDEIWRMATQGQFLTPEGWRVAGGFFTEPRPFPANEKILVVGNEWEPANEWNTNETTAEVSLVYVDAGTIDAMLRYHAPPKTDVFETAVAYNVVTVPAYTMMYAPDGKTLVEKKPTGTLVWKIKGSQGPPFTTVNTAIRYVLEVQEKTADRAIKENANHTLAQLMKFR